MTGQKFGRLTVLERVENHGKVLRWRCQCDCGAETVVRGKNLRTGGTLSCGCLRRDRAKGITQEGSRNPVWSGDAVTYQAQHLRVRRRRGKASEHACVDCGEPAAHWSYRKDCPDERFETRQASKTRKPVRAPYCPHVECYEPRCLSCHNVYDKNQREAVA